MADDTYNCVLCKDAHFVHPCLSDGSVDYSQAVPCLCVQEKMARDRKQRLLSWCELPVASEKMTFETYKGNSSLQQAYEAAMAVATGELLWLTLISGANRGKTHLAVAVCRRWLESDKPARYAYVPLLMEELRRGYSYKENDYDKRFEMYLNVPLLALDDLGVENATPWVQEKLNTIVDYRLMHELALVVTTNLSLLQIPDRIASRLKRAGMVITINSDEYRK